MNTKVIIIVLGIAAFVASWFVESRLAPVIGSALLLGAIIYGWAANKSSKTANFEEAERAAKRQKENHAFDERPFDENRS